MTWEHAPLKKITTKISSGATPRGGKNSYKTEGITLIRSLNVHDYEFSYEGLAFITEEQASETRLGRVTVEAKDILLNRTGASVARCCMVPEHLLPATINQHVSLVRVDSNYADSHYVLCCINSPTYKHRLLTLAQGGITREALTKEILSNFEIPLPPLSIQRKIAVVLSTYTDLIENNTRRIEILEEMASAIYRAWFVEFRFPRHESVEMVESELGLIPQGWEVKRLDEVAQLYRGKSYRSQNIVGDGEGLPFVNLKNIDREGGFRSDGLKWYNGHFQETQIAISNDLVMALTDKTHERRVVARSARIPNLGHEKYVLSIDLVKIKPEESIQTDFLEALLRYSSLPEKLKEYAHGATVLRLSPKHVQSSKLVLPPSELRQRYAEIVKSIHQQSDLLEKKNANLRQTRDLLLPKLISGEIDLSELDITTD